MGCLAHIRRKFFDIYEATCSPLAETALKWIAALYRIEREINGSPPDVRKAVRQEKSRPVFEAFSDWLIAVRPALPKGQPLMKAVNYAITQKNIILGRKNFLFFGNDRAGDHAAILYTLIETAKLNSVNSQAWLAHVIETIGDAKQTQLDHLLPWNWNSAN